MRTQIVLQNVGVQLPNRLLFEGVNFTVREGMRVCLAGRNGSGKSTLLRILAQRVEPTTGKCTWVGKEMKVGFLDQSLLDSAVKTAQKEATTQSSLEYLTSTLPENEKEAPENRQWEIKRILSGLGFHDAWMVEPYGHLSGGWLLRMFIAKELLVDPELLLMDEPTNHLDISSIQWLEEFLKKEYRGSLILVSHDVALQKRVTDSLAVIHAGRFHQISHMNDYLSFRESLKGEEERLEKQIGALDKKIEDNREFVARFRAKAQTAARAQSKLKTIEALEIEKDEAQTQLERTRFNYGLDFRFAQMVPSGKFPLSLRALSFRYANKDPWILKNLNFDIKRGERIAILGDNGAGKTTLLNVMAGRLIPSEGSLSVGHQVQLGYFGQHQLDELSFEDTVLEHFRTVARGLDVGRLRGWLGAFGFSGSDEVEKKIKALSGGERARLALLKILVKQANVCLLDEPTNHLDVETKELLKNAIKDFEGTTIFVSHDREFATDIANRILYLTSDHRLVDHHGDVPSFFEKYPEHVRHLLERKATRTEPQVTRENSLSYEERKALRNSVKNLEKKIEQIEREIETLTEEKRILQQLMSEADFYSREKSEQQACFEKLGSLDKKLMERMVQWDKMSQELEAKKKVL